MPYQLIIASSLTRPLRLAVRTSGFHPDNRSSTLLGVTIYLMGSSLVIERVVLAHEVVGLTPTFPAIVRGKPLVKSLVGATLRKYGVVTRKQDPVEGKNTGIYTCTC